MLAVDDGRGVTLLGKECFGAIGGNLGSNDFDSARTRGNSETAIVRCHYQFFLHSVAPN
jgi:hypothetical protein